MSTVKDQELDIKTYKKYANLHTFSHLHTPPPSHSQLNTQYTQNKTHTYTQELHKMCMQKFKLKLQEWNVYIYRHENF